MGDGHSASKLLKMVGQERLLIILTEVGFGSQSAFVN
jgi:hypothetical protein